MTQDQKSTGLLKRRRFLPLFLTQFLGATNDSLFKQALFILITFRLAQEQGLNGALMVAVGGGLFILPFFLFSATAGQLADKFDKSRLIRVIKAGEIAIMLLAAVGFYFDNVVFLMTVLFLMGAQSSFFGPDPSFPVFFVSTGLFFSVFSVEELAPLVFVRVLPFDPVFRL